MHRHANPAQRSRARLVAATMASLAVALVACGCSKSSGTIATDGTAAERALCVNVAKTTWQASTPNLLDAVLNDPGASPAMVRDSSALKEALPGVPQTDAEVTDALAKLAIDCQSPVGSS